MKIVCTQENLKNGLIIVGKIVSQNNTLPILNNILFKTENGLLKISSTNLEIAITTYVRCKIEEPGEIALPCKLFIDLVNNLPNKNISLTQEGNELKIETENYETKIKTLPADDLPQIPQNETDLSFLINPEEFKNALEKVVHSASTNQTQLEICGVLFSLSDNKVKFVATDRYRLSEKIMYLKHSGVTKEVIVPAKTVFEICRLAGSEKKDMSVFLGSSQIVFNLGETMLLSRVIDGQYPDYNQIIPTTYNTKIVTNKKNLINALKTSGVFSQSSGSVNFSFSKQKQTVSLNTESSDLGKSLIELPSEITGEDGSMILNFRYLLDCLQVILGEKIIFKIINDSSPTVISSDEENGYLYLVMPIKL